MYSHSEWSLPKLTLTRKQSRVKTVNNRDCLPKGECIWIYIIAYVNQNAYCVYIRDSILAICTLTNALVCDGQAIIRNSNVYSSNMITYKSVWLLIDLK